MKFHVPIDMMIGRECRWSKAAIEASLDSGFDGMRPFFESMSDLRKLRSYGAEDVKL